MKLTLMIEGSKEAIAAILANLPNDASIASVAPTPITEGKVLTPPMQPAATAMAPAGFTPSPISAPAAAPTDEGDEGPANANAPDVDATGIRWDERIHSATKGLTNDGKWRKRRGVDAATISAVEAELRGPVPMPSVPMQPVQAAPAPMPLQPMPMQQPIPMQMPPQQVAVQQATEGTAIDFAGFMAHISPKFGQIDPATGSPVVHADYLGQVTNEINQAFGTQLQSITDIAADPQKINYAVQILQRDGKW